MAILFREINSAGQDPEEGGAPIGIADMEDRTIQVGTKLPVKIITAAYTVTGEDSGSILSVRSAASCTITFPSAAASKGMHVWVFNCADFNLVLATVANELMAFNDVDADALTFSQATELIGAAVHMICDGVSWLALVHLAAEGLDLSCHHLVTEGRG